MEPRRARFRQWVTFAIGSMVAAPGLGPVADSAYATEAVATSASPPHSHWLSWITNAQGTLDSSTFPSVEVARNELDREMNNLETYLDRTPQHKDNWLQFLKWNQLKEELSKDRKGLDRFQQLEKNFRQNFNGLELSPFTKVRIALERYRQAEQFGSDSKRSIGILSNRLTKLEERVVEGDLFGDSESMRDLAQTIAYLSESRQASGFVRQVQNELARPNVRVLVSSAFVQSRFGRAVYEPSPVCENILGTTIVGSGVLTGHVTPMLVDSPHQAMIRLNLHGNFSSNNVGHNRGVKLYTQGSANVTAWETIALGDHGLHALNDTGVNADLATHINSIDAKLRIIRKVAAKQAAKQKPEADAIARGRMENRIRNQFHTQLVSQLSESNQRIGTPSMVELIRLGLTKPDRTSWSSSQFLSLLWKVQSGSQLAAPSSCPHAIPTTGIAVQLHESSISNLLDPVLAGRLLKSEDSELYRRQFGELATGAFNQRNADNWSVTLANFQPVEVRFRDSNITFCIRTTKLDRGDQSLDQAATIEASYQPVLIDGELQLVRVGDVRIRFSGTGQSGMRATTMRTFLRRKFEEVFKEELLEEPVNIAKRLPADLKDLRLAGVTSDQGWLQLHVD